MELDPHEDCFQFVLKALGFAVLLSYWVVFNYLGTFGEQFINDGLRSSKKKIYHQDQKSHKKFSVKIPNRYIISVVHDVRISVEV